MRRRSRGFTLPELMATLAAAGAFGAAITSVSLRIGEEGKLAVGRQADLDGLRKAARLLEADLRTNLSPEALGWSLDGDVLSRGTEVVARSVATFRTRLEHDVWHVWLAVKPRATEGPRREATIEWFVRVRTTEDER
jgi:prepilin-type N-terminal cleavage/methylation domain-containing protein